MTEYQLIGDQPMTCPKCGARTDWEMQEDGTQVHTCLGCGNEFLACEDDEEGDREYEFRLIAFDETSFWSELPKGCTRVFGLYLFRVGEATFVASLTPSSWCCFISNEFMGENVDREDDIVAEWANRGEDNYYAYIDPERLPQLASESFTVEAGSVDAAWDVAVEYAHENPPFIALPE